MDVTSAEADFLLAELEGEDIKWLPFFFNCIDFFWRDSLILDPGGLYAWCIFLDVTLLTFLAHSI